MISKTITISDADEKILLYNLLDIEAWIDTVVAEKIKNTTTQQKSQPNPHKPKNPGISARQGGKSM